MMIKKTGVKVGLNIVVLIALGLLASCSYLPRNTQAPLSVLVDQQSDTAKTLIIFLPGLGDNAKDFKKHGFFDQVRKLDLSIDLMAVNAHFSYYRKGVFKQRLHEDVLRLAIEKGYQNIWLCGISLGGYGALLAMQAYSESLSGIILMAPWLGDQAVISEVQKGGGIKRWSPRASYQYGQDHQYDLWVWLKEHSDDLQTQLPIYLLYGQQDRFNLAHTILANELSEEKVMLIEGKHNWRAWTLLWERLLDEKGFISELTH